MQHLKKIRKLNQQKAQKEFALSQLISNKKKSELQTKKIQQSFLQKSTNQNNQAFFVRDLDNNNIHFIDQEDKVDRLLSNLSTLPQIDALLEGIWNKYMNALEKQQEVFLEACYQGQTQMVKKVVSSKNKHPIDPKTANTDQGKNGIHLATISGSYRNIQIISVLVTCGVDINGITNNQNRTPLMLGSILGNDIAVRALLQNKAKIDLQDYEGNTALHLACIYNQESIVQILLDNQCSFEIKNKKEMTAIDCIINVHIFQLIKLKVQIKHGKNFNYELLFPGSRKNHIQKLLNNLKQKQREQTTTMNTTMQQSILPKLKIKSSRQQRQQKIKQVMIKEIKQINLSSFRKLSLLGKGAFGQVFLVQNINDQKQYAMKVLDKGMIMRQNILRYAMTERKILSTINHPFVVRLHYAFQTSQKLFLVMQNCPGGDLLQLIKKKGKLQEGIVKKYSAQIILAIQQLHKAQIIYRDLKAGNIVLDKDGHACITDFGLSKQAALSHSFCGSTAYLAPQMIWRRGHTKMLDWYLLGVFIYECLTGRPPFWDTNKQQLLSNIKSGRYKPLCSQFSNQVRDFVDNLLRANYSKRLGISGVDSLKNHSWFKNTDWKKVLNREQEMDAIEIKQGKPIKQEQFVQPKFIDNKIKGWQFAQNK